VRVPLVPLAPPPRDPLGGPQQYTSSRHSDALQVHCPVELHVPV
jgi:hypothetical protein